MNYMNLIRYDSIECSQSPWNGTKPRRVNIVTAVES